MKVVAYCRVATNNQLGAEFELITQKKLIEEYAEKEGYQITNIFNNCSNGIVDNLPFLQQIIDSPEEIILVRDISRISRKSHVVIKFIDELKNKGKKLICINNNEIYPNDLSDLIIKVCN